MEDNAPCHTITDYFAENDLNPIKNLWAWIDNRLGDSDLSSNEGLEAALHQIWLSVPDYLCSRLVESMPKRIRACIETRSSHIKHEKIA